MVQSHGVSNLQANMQNIFGGLRKRANKEGAEQKGEDSSVHLNDRDDLMEDDDDEYEAPLKSKKNTRRPKETAFTQQHLAAVHPILTAKTIVPLFVCLAIIFIPIGAAMLKASENVQDLQIDYSHCSEVAKEGMWTTVPDEYYEFHFQEDVTIKPQWRLGSDSAWDAYPEEKVICEVQFEIPNTMKGPIYYFYKLTNFHANHRQYVKSFSEDQIQGKVASVSTIRDSVGQNCKPLATDDAGKIIYPCGLIANSMFNDTFTSNLIGVNGTTSDFTMTNKGIAWSTNSKRFQKTQYSYKDIVPPPNWVKKFPEGYNSSNVPDISQWAEFQNWMAPAALADFSNMVLRSDEDLGKGVYQTNVGLHFPTVEYNGKKIIYITTSSAIGGRNSFLGVAWIIGGAICLALALAVFVGVLLKGRKSGDTSLLSWNRGVVDDE